MNLVGNSLKYTAAGYIKVSLRLEDSKDKSSELGKPEKLVVLQVCDTGKGISTEFLKNKLFTAFSQESSLAPGTGLGLHIVDSLVRMYHGIIDVQSQLGRGTSVTVRLPLVKATAGISSIDSSNASLKDDVSKVHSLLRKLKNPTFSIHGFYSTSSSSVETSIHGYLLNWFGLKNSFSIGGPANIAFINENEYGECLPCLEGDQKPSHVIIVRDVANHNHSPPPEHISGIPIEILTVPFGPCKLTKALLACLSPRSTPPRIASIPRLLNGGMSPLASPIIEQTPRESPRISPRVSPRIGFDANINNADGRLPQQQLSDSSPPPSSRPQPKILCVDDNPINLRLLRAFFQKLNFTDITCAENGAQAFEAYRRRIEGFDIVFMDLNMPVCDGFEATRLIRSLEKLQQSITTPPVARARVVALTGIFSYKDTQAAKAAGIDDFLTKPMKLSALASMMKEWGFDDPQAA
ncbi:sensor histidine kinase response protein [Rutstroemia sp. NJR-2017a WRK4]|nr:sensor histidine kinase response protein [Rutstroemia sp. NJR-2017a WRK4]